MDGRTAERSPAGSEDGFPRRRQHKSWRWATTANPPGCLGGWGRGHKAVSSCGDTVEHLGDFPLRFSISSYI